MRGLFLGIRDEDFDFVCQLINTAVVPSSPDMIIMKSLPEPLHSDVESSASVVESADLPSPQLDEQEALLQQCAELSERLALFGKKKQISQRK